MSNKKLYLILGMFAIIFTFFGGTLSYIQWRTSSEQETSVAFTVTEDFSCSADGGGNITNGTQTLMPTTSCTHETYAIQKTITVNNILNSDKSNLTMDLWLNINEIGTGLSNSENLRYALTTTENDCTLDIVSYGTFTGKTANNQILLLDDEMYSSSRTDTYYLYIWMDSDETSHDIVNQTIDLSLGGNCTGTSKGEPFYAVYSADDTSLRFYKETEEVITEGSTYNNLTATNVYKAYENDIYTYDGPTTNTTSPWNEVRDNVTTIVVEDEISPYSLANWFTYFQNVTSIDVSNLNTSNTVSMRNMFGRTGYNATEFTITGLNNWNTSSVINVRSMFNQAGYNATTWNIGDLSSWNVSNVLDMSYMFNKTGYSATTFDIGSLSSWNTSNVTNMTTMFQGAGYNTTTWNIGDLSGWNTSNVTNMGYMFNQAGRNATTWNIGDLSNWNVSNVTNMTGMFQGAGYSATTFNIGDLNNWDTSNVTNMNAMFCGAGINATTFNIGNLSNWNTSKVTNMVAMFQQVGQVAVVTDLGDLNTKVVIKSDGTTYVAWDVSNVTKMSYMFYGICGDVSNVSVCNIGSLSNWNTSSVTDMSYMFDFAGSYIETDNARFGAGDLSKKTVTLSNGTSYTAWNTENVINMEYMFGTARLKSTYTLDLSNWNVDKVTSYTGFYSGETNQITVPTWVNEDQGDLSTTS